MNYSSNNQYINSDKNIDKGKILCLNYNEKMEYYDNLTAYYPKLIEIIKKVTECQNSSSIYNKPNCMRISGPSGSGKSRIAEIFQKKYPPIETAEGIEKKVLYVELPCPAYVGSLPSTFLYSLGDPFYAKHDRITLTTQRLYDMLKACNVKLIFIDEVQHLVDRNSQKLLRDSSDWFKVLIDKTRIPIIFLGMPDSSKIFTENEQLANRVRLVEETTPFNYNDDFRKILYFFDTLAPLKELSGLAEPDLSKRIYLATEGLIKHIHDLLTESASIALKNNATRITMPMLSNAFAKLFYNKLESNPFSPKLDNCEVQEQIQNNQISYQIS